MRVLVQSQEEEEVNLDDFSQSLCEGAGGASTSAATTMRPKGIVFLALVAGLGRRSVKASWLGAC